MGGDWNMTIGQKDQKLKRFNVNKNKPLKELDEKLGTRDVWRKLHQGDNMEFTWRKGDGMAQEKRIDGFRTNNTTAHLTCNTHETHEIESDHRPVETIREWSPITIKEKQPKKRRRIPTDPSGPEKKAYNSTVTREVGEYTYILRQCMRS